MNDHPMLQKFAQELADPNNRLLDVTLKCHLVLEQALNNALNAYFPNLPLDELRLQARQKLLLLQSILPSAKKDRLAAFFAELNALRNKLAHSLEHDKIQENLKRLVEIYQREYSRQLPESERVLPSDPLAQIQLMAVHALGDACGLESELQTARKEWDEFKVWKANRK
jgi:hypothetical protein